MGEPVMSANYSLYGRKIEFNNAQLEYNKWRLFYDDLAVKCADKYLYECYKKYDGLDGFSKNGFEGGWNVIGEALTKTIQICANAKRYDIDENSFVDQYGEYCFSDWVEVFNEINDKYMEIVLKAEELDKYRTQRRQSRARIVGGGFGLQGAVKGMMTAGAANMAWGAVHGAFNLVGKGISMIGDSIQKSNIYNSEETKKNLWYGIYGAVFNIHYALCKIFKIPVIADGDIKTADTLFKNIGRMKQEDIMENLVKILSLDPYKRGAYEYCIEAYGDKQNEVQKMANFFNVDVERFKNNLLAKRYSKLDLSNEESALIAKATLQNDISQYGMKTCDIMKEIDKKLELFDQQARTVDGEIFATREEASIASTELQKIKTLMKDNDLSSAAGVEKVLTIISQNTFSTSVKNKYVADLNTKLGAMHKKEIQQIIKQGNTSMVEGITDILVKLENGKYTGTYLEQELDKLYQKRAKLDCEMRTVEGTVYESKEDADKAKVELEQLNKILKQCKLSTVSGSQAAIQQLKAANFNTRSALAKITEIENKCKKLDEKERTVKGKVFDNIEEAHAAKNKARIVPIVVFVLIVGLLMLPSSSNAASLKTNLCYSIAFTCVPWALFALVKPQTATFYITSSRLKAIGTFVALFLVLIIVGSPQN
jgi:hypothetical protein